MERKQVTILPINLQQGNVKTLLYTKESTKIMVGRKSYQEHIIDTQNSGKRLNTITYIY